MKKRGIGVAVVLAIIAAVLVWRLYFVQKSDEGSLLLSGNMEVTEINVGFKPAGRVIALAAEEGQEVKEGDLLARLDNAELADVVSQNRAALQEAASRVAELKAGSRPQELEQARANLRAQDAELERARKDFDRAQTLHANGAIPTAQLDVARSAYEARSAQRKGAAEALDIAKEGPRKEVIEAAEARVSQGRAAVRTAEQRLADTEIHSPIDGVVLKKNVEIGETVAQGVPIYTIGDLSRPWIKVYVKEDKVGLVKLGQPATVIVDTAGGTQKKGRRQYEGSVSYISSEAEFTPKSVQTQEERVKLVFGIKVRVNDAKRELKPGMPADVRIEVK
jgi:HlyD family secretion protein